MGTEVRTTEYYLPLEGLMAVEVARTELGMEIQRIKRAQLILSDKRGGTKIIHLSDFRDARGLSLEQAIAAESDALHSMLDDEMAREVAWLCP